MILLLALGAAPGTQAYLSAGFQQGLTDQSKQAGMPALQGQAAQSSPAQPPVCETLPFGKTIDREPSVREKHCYSFTLEAGQFVQVLVEQRGIDVSVRIFGQDVKPLTSIDRLNSIHGPENASLIARSSGVYRLQIESLSVSVRGLYRVTLTEPRAATPSDEKRVNAERLISEAEDLRARNTAETARLAAGKYEKARDLWSEVGDRYEEGFALFGAGYCHRLSGANQTAIAVYERALELMRETRDSFGIALVQGGMGFSYYYLGALDQALENFEQSLQTRQRMLDRVGAGRLHYGIGWVRINRKENQLALESFKESLRLRQEVKDPKGAAITRIGLGKAYFRLERYDEARAMLEEALQTMRDSDDVGGQIERAFEFGLDRYKAERVCDGQEAFW